MVVLGSLSQGPSPDRYTPYSLHVVPLLLVSGAFWSPCWLSPAVISCLLSSESGHSMLLAKVWVRNLRIHVGLYTCFSTHVLRLHDQMCRCCDVCYDTAFARHADKKVRNITHFVDHMHTQRHDGTWTVSMCRWWRWEFMHVLRHVYIHTYTRTRTHTRIHTHTHTHTHMYMNIYIHCLET